MTRKILTILIFSVSMIFAAHSKEIFKEEKIIETNKTMALAMPATHLEPGKKHEISFHAKTNSDNTIEANERIRLMDLRYVGSRLRMEFYDKDGKAFPHNRMDIPVITRNFHDYALVFYPPSKAQSLKIFLIPDKEAEMAVKKIEIATDLKGEESECLNPHPTFEHGELNFYGYSLGYGGMFYTRPDGRTVWKTGFLGYTPSFPLKEKTFYDIYCKGKKYRGRKSWMLLECYNAKSRKPFKTMRINLNDKGEVTKLKTPAGTAYGKLRCYCVIIEKFKVTESKQ